MLLLILYWQTKLLWIINIIYKYNKEYNKYNKEQIYINLLMK